MKEIIFFFSLDECHLCFILSYIFSGEGLSQLIIMVYVRTEIQQFFTLGVYSKKKKVSGSFFILKETLEIYLTIL